MKKAYLLYTEKDAAKNAGYIECFISEAKKRNVELILKTDDKDMDFACDFVINRSRDHIISEKFDHFDVPVFNSTDVCRICNDKWLTYEYFKDIVPMAHTSLTADFSPAVIKPKRGHGGQNITLAKTKEECEAGRKQALEYQDYSLSGQKHQSGCIFQKYIDGKKDIRVYILGGEILSAVERSAKDDFRSNFSLGGIVREAEILPEIKKIVSSVTSAMHFDLAGIDIISDGEKFVLNEIEDAVGARMLYSLKKDINLPAMYIDLILKRI